MSAVPLRSSCLQARNAASPSPVTPTGDGGPGWGINFVPGGNGLSCCPGPHKGPHEPRALGFLLPGRPQGPENCPLDTVGTEALPLNAQEETTEGGPRPLHIKVDKIRDNHTMRKECYEH